MKEQNKYSKHRHHLHKQVMEQLVNDELKINKQKEFLRSFEEEQKERLSRTIFVTNIKDIRIRSNLQALQDFFENNYGPVEQCCVSSFENKRQHKKYSRKRNDGPPPPARVSFRDVQSAMSIFGMPLDEARKAGTKEAMKLIPATRIAYHGKHNPGKLKVYPAEKKKSNAVLVNDSADILSKTIAVTSLSLGHWVPEDSGQKLLNGVRATDEYEFLEEYCGFHSSRMILDLRRRLIQFQTTNTQSGLFFSNSSDSKQLYTVTIRLKEIDTYIDLAYQKEDNKYCLVFSCSESPKLHEIHITEQLGFPYEKSTRLTHLNGAPFDHCFGYKVHCNKSEFNSLFNSQENFHLRLQDFGLMRSECLGDSLSISSKRIVFGSKKKSKLEHSINSLNHPKLRVMARSILDKGRLISWFDALENYFLISDTKYNMFEIINLANYEAAVAALASLKDMNGSTRYPSKVLHTFLQEGGWKTVTEYPSYCAEIPRVMVTPTREIVSGFDIEISNRVVREFIRQGYAENDFLRVSFCDENGSRLSNDDFKSQYVAGKIERLLLSPFILNGNQYKFLAYSSSQLKEASVWLINCSENPNLVSEIRNSLGDLTGIKIPSKYAARMGQCFSTTIETLSGVNFRSDGRIFEHLLIDDSIDDVVSMTDSGCESCHSDGTGLIRKDVLKRILGVVPSVKHEIDDISIIQVRIGGAKGTLTAWDNHPCLRFKDICLRSSMIKFPAPYNNLEVVKVGRHVPYYLNRQMIMLLGHHNVPIEIFLEMQKSMLEDLDSMLINPERAHKNLNKLGGLDSGVKETLLNMLQCGFCPQSDPFLFSCLHALRAQLLMNLKKKSRIFVESGAIVIGGLDESGEVPQGCVFLQVRSTKTNKFMPLEGPILIAKHPVTHPGDVRMLLAINVSKLKGHKNVLLFSKHGNRAEADKMSGSDLDGDEFAITWDERLFLNDWNGCSMISNGLYLSKCGKKHLIATTDNLFDIKNANHLPMDFDTQGNAKSVNEVMDKHLVQHFINFGASDSLGRIATLWLDHAAKNKSAACKQCMELAELHSVAVDFPKSGIPAVIPQSLLIPSSAPRPHWREKKGSDSYYCDSSIGQLYDEVVVSADKKEFFKFHAAVAGRTFNKKGQLLCFASSKRFSQDHSSIYRTNVVEKLDLISSSIDEMKHFLLFASEQKNLYDDSLLTLMNKYKIHSEGEVLTGCIMKFHKLNKRRQHSLAEEVRRQSKQLRINCRNLFLQQVLSTVLPLDSILEVEMEYEMEYYIEWVNIVASSSTATLKEKLQLVTKQAAQDCICLNMNEFDVMKCRSMARKMAAAYYAVTFYPMFINQLRDDNSSASMKTMKCATLLEKDVTIGNREHSLYSFPHIVNDIISMALLEHE